jgi:hypothetical protein
MKLLPIVGRELREGSRRGGTYWLRSRVAAQALVIGIAGYVINVLNPPMKMGTVLFWGLAGVSMLFCLFAGRRSTADCLSREKRDGTLGLLFLTDLKGYDVVLGKLAATSVTGLYALLAVFPVMAVPLLTGGMTRGEVGRMILVLTTTFFFSSAIGIFASAVSREYRAAMAANFLVWLALVGVPVGAGYGIEIAKSRWVWPLFYSCPVFSFYQCADRNYAMTPGDFWWSIGVTSGLAWILAALACVIVPRTWGDKPARAPGERLRWRWRDLESLITYGTVAGRINFRRKALNSNAYFWHAARARLKPAHVWLFVVLGGAWWIYCWVKNGAIWLDETTFVFTAAVLNGAFKLWIVLEAGQRLGEDRRSGAYELLLATPLTVRDIVRGQWMALRRQFLRPLLVVIVVEIGFVAMMHHMHKASALLLTVSLLVLPFDLAALVWAAMSAALTAKSQMKATVEAVGRILILPWGIFGLVHAGIAAYSWLAFRPWEPSVLFEVFEWVGISLAVDAIFGVWAWHSVRREFRRLATQSTEPVNWSLLLGECAVWMGALWRRVPARVRIPVGAGTVAAVGAVLLYSRPRKIEFPPTVVVSITQSNAPMRIFRSGMWGVFFVLPDGSLWQWGKPGAPQASRAEIPEQVGARRDWLKVMAVGWSCLGLTADGTIWSVGPSNGTNAITLQRALAGSDWADLGGADPQYAIALKKNGTIWGWSPRMLPGSLPAAQIGKATNWIGVYSRDFKYLGLRSDGTLWAWGVITSKRGGVFWANTNVDDPVLLCADKNWISLDGDGHARNKDGELWDVYSRVPKPDASVSNVCERITTAWASYRIEAAPYRMNCRSHPDGTLWTAPIVSDTGSWDVPATSSPTETQFGTRSDWVGLWSVDGTAFGLTADGVLWTWGYDLGREPDARTINRIQLMRAAYSGLAGANSILWSQGGPSPPILKEPRALMKIVKRVGE